MAVELQRVVLDGRPEGAEFGSGDFQDFGQVEIGVAEFVEVVDDTIGGLVAETGVSGAKFFPGQAQGAIELLVTDFTKRVRIGGGATVGDPCQGLMPAQPLAQLKRQGCEGGRRRGKHYFC
jgi:hypothetical protein